MRVVTVMPDDRAVGGRMIDPWSNRTMVHENHIGCSAGALQSVFHIAGPPGEGISVAPFPVDLIEVPQDIVDEIKAKLEILTS